MLELRGISDSAIGEWLNYVRKLKIGVETIEQNIAESRDDADG